MTKLESVFFVVGPVVLGLMVSWAAPARAQAAGGANEGGKQADGQSTDDDAPRVKVERGASGQKVYRIQDEIRIEGKIQKPEAFYVLQKSSINYDWQELKQQFIPKILDSVRKAPF